MAKNEVTLAEAKAIIREETEILAKIETGIAEGRKCLREERRNVAKMKGAELVRGRKWLKLAEKRLARLVARLNEEKRDLAEFSKRVAEHEKARDGLRAYEAMADLLELWIFCKTGTKPNC